MNLVLSPMTSEFENQAQEDSYTLWLRHKYASNLADTLPNVTHDDVMSRARAFLDQKKPNFLAVHWKASPVADLLEILA